jgi:hypothetical protein
MPEIERDRTDLRWFTRITIDGGSKLLHEPMDSSSFAR